MIAGIEVDGYLSVKDSFVSDKLPEELAGLQKEGFDSLHYAVYYILKQ